MDASSGRYQVHGWHGYMKHNEDQISDYDDHVHDHDDLDDCIN